MAGLPSNMLSTIILVEKHLQVNHSTIILSGSGSQVDERTPAPAGCLTQPGRMGISYSVARGGDESLR
jgi:hypothetical protein